jgi:hypothetical protein
LAVVVLQVVSFRALARQTPTASQGEQSERARVLQLISLFAPAVTAVGRDPRAILEWQPLASTSRKLFPAEFDQIDTAFGGTFPFNREQIQQAHSQWTADWLAWEAAHDVEYKLKAATIEGDLAATGSSTVLRARLDAVEREKLDRYQRRYQEYVRVSKALQVLAG